MNITFSIIFLAAALLFGVLYLISRDKYNDFIEPLEKKGHPFKQFYPIALYLLDIFKYNYSTKYDRNLLMKVSEISGHKYSQYYLTIHWANKITYMYLALMFILLIGINVGTDIGFIIFGLILIGLIFFLVDNELSEKIKKRRLSIQMDFPDFINKLTLLINAGMTVSRAWEKIVSDNKKQTQLFQELEIALSDIKSGKAESQAYEDFAKRCRIKEITKFVSIIVQNLRKGGSEIVSVLRLQANECWEMRKAAAKRLGEESSTKMMLPLMMMFLAILLIVATPAILAMSGI